MKVIRLDLRVAAFLSAFFLLFDQISSAATPVLSVQSHSAVNQPAISISSELGTIENSPSQSEISIVHIQTAHGNYEAQRKIAALLNELYEHYGFSLILVEGSAFPLDPNLARFYPQDPKTTAAILDRLAQKGIAKGPEIFLSGNTHARGYGIEDLRLYNKNGRALNAVLHNMKRTERVMAKLETAIQSRVAKGDPSLRDFIRDESRYSKGELSLVDWLGLIKARAAEVLQLDLENPVAQLDWPMLVRLLSVAKMESRLNKEGLNRDRKNFLSRYRDRFGTQSDQIEAMIGDGALSAFNRPSSREAFLFMLSRLPSDFDFGSFPHLASFLGILLLQPEIRMAEVMRELQLLANKIEDQLARSQVDHDLLQLLRDYKLVQKLTTLKLTSEDAEMLATRKVRANDFLKRATFGETPALNKKETLLFFQTFAAATAFYKTARARDSAMLKNIELKLKTTGEKKAVVITGGFHAQPFREYFSGRNYNYALILPNLEGNHAPSDNGYYEIFKRYDAKSQTSESSAHEHPYFLTTPPSLLIKKQHWRARKLIQNEILPAIREVRRSERIPDPIIKTEIRRILRRYRERGVNRPSLRPRSKVPFRSELRSVGTAQRVPVMWGNYPALKNYLEHQPGFKTLPKEVVTSLRLGLLERALVDRKIPLEELPQRLQDFMEILRKANLNEIVITGETLSRIYFGQDPENITVSLKLDLTDWDRDLIGSQKDLLPPDLYALADLELKKFAGKLNVRPEAFLQPLGNQATPRFEGIEVRYYGPTEEDNSQYVKRYLVDAETKAVFFSDTGDALSKMAMDRKGNLYGPVDSLISLLYGQLDIAGEADLFSSGDILRVLRFKHAFDLKLSPAGETVLKAAAKIFEARLTSHHQYLIERLIDTALYPFEAKKELVALNILPRNHPLLSRRSELRGISSVLKAWLLTGVLAGPVALNASAFSADAFSAILSPVKDPGNLFIDKKTEDISSPAKKDTLLLNSELLDTDLNKANMQIGPGKLHEGLIPFANLYRAEYREALVSWFATTSSTILYSLVRLFKKIIFYYGERRTPGFQRLLTLLISRKFDLKTRTRALRALENYGSTLRQPILVLLKDAYESETDQAIKNLILDVMEKSPQPYSLNFFISRIVPEIQLRERRAFVTRLDNMMQNAVIDDYPEIREALINRLGDHNKSVNEVLQRIVGRSKDTRALFYTALAKDNTSQASEIEGSVDLAIEALGHSGLRIRTNAKILLKRRKMDRKARFYFLIASGKISEAAKIPEALLYASEAAVHSSSAIRVAGMGVMAQKKKIEINAVKKLIMDRDASIRRRAAGLMIYSESSERIDILTRLLGSDDSADVRVEAARVLGSLQDRAAVSELINALADPEPAVQLAVAEALNRIGSEKARFYYYLYNKNLSPSMSNREFAAFAVREAASHSSLAIREQAAILSTQLLAPEEAGRQVANFLLEIPEPEAAESVLKALIPLAPEGVKPMEETFRTLLPGLMRVKRTPRIVHEKNAGLFGIDPREGQHFKEVGEDDRRDAELHIQPFFQYFIRLGRHARGISDDLIRFVQNHADSKQSAGLAIHALGAIGEAKEEAFITNLFLTRRDESLDTAIVEGLTKINSNRTRFFVLVHQGKSEEASRVPRALDFVRDILLSLRIREIGIEGLRPVQRQIAVTSLEVLGNIQRSEATDELLSLLRVPEFEETRAAAAKSLGRLVEADPRVAGALITALTQDVVAVKKEAALSLANTRAQEAEIPLLKQLTLNPPEVQSAIKIALSKLGYPPDSALITSLARLRDDERMMTVETVVLEINALISEKPEGWGDHLLAQLLEDKDGKLNQYIVSLWPLFSESLKNKSEIQALMRQQAPRHLSRFAEVLRGLESAKDLPSKIPLGVWRGREQEKIVIEPVFDPVVLAAKIQKVRKPNEFESWGISILFDTGDGVSQEEEGKFLALYLHIATSDLVKSFLELKSAPEQDGKTSYGLLFHGQEANRRLSFFFTLPPSMTEAELAEFLKRFQLLSTGLLLAATEEQYRMYFPEEVERLFPIPLLAAAQEYRDFRSEIVRTLRLNNHYRDKVRERPDLFYSLPDSPHNQDRLEALNLYGFEESLFDDRQRQWLMTSSSGSRPWNELVRRLWSTEMMMLNLDQAEEDQTYGRPITRGRFFIDEIDRLGVIAANKIERRLQGGTIPKELRLGMIRNPFIDLKDPAATRHYLEKMLQAKTEGRLLLSRVPYLQQLNAALKYYELEPLVRSELRIARQNSSPGPTIQPTPKKVFLKRIPDENNPILRPHVLNKTEFKLRNQILPVDLIEGRSRTEVAAALSALLQKIIVPSEEEIVGMIEKSKISGAGHVLLDEQWVRIMLERNPLVFSRLLSGLLKYQHQYPTSRPILAIAAETDLYALIVSRLQEANIFFDAADLMKVVEVIPSGRLQTYLEDTEYSVAGLFSSAVEIKRINLAASFLFDPSGLSDDELSSLLWLVPTLLKPAELLQGISDKNIQRSVLQNHLKQLLPGASSLSQGFNINSAEFINAILAHQRRIDAAA